MSLVRYPVGMELACALSPKRGLRGACSTLAHAARAVRCGLNNPLWNKYAIAFLIFRRNMEEYEADGNGNRAARRVMMIESPAPLPLTDADIDNLSRTKLILIQKQNEK